MKSIAILAAIAMLSGCGLYSRYSRPEEISTSGLYRDIETSDTASIASSGWRDFFQDTCLTALIDTALIRNADVRIATYRIDAAEAALKTSRLAYLPALTFNAEGGVNGGAADGKTFALTPSASWDIDFFGRQTNVKRAARAAFEGSLAYAQAVRTKVIADVATGYYTLLLLDAQLDINSSTLETWMEMEQTLEALKRAGKSDDAAVLQARASRLALESSNVSLLQSIRETENSLSLLLGKPSFQIERLSLDCQEFPDTVSAGIPLRLLSSRPDVRQAEAALAQSFYNVNTVRASFYPSVTLSGSAGWTNNAGGVILDPAAWLTGAIASLTQPLFRHGANVAALKQAKAAYGEALASFSQTLLQAGKEVNDAVTGWQAAGVRINLDIKQVEALTEAVRKTDLLMRHSSVNYLEVLTARQALLSARQSLVRDRAARVQSVIALYYALGFAA